MRRALLLFASGNHVLEMCNVAPRRQAADKAGVVLRSDPAAPPRPGMLHCSIHMELADGPVGRAWMAGLGSTLADLAARAREGLTQQATQPRLESPLRNVVSFGANPGALRMCLYVPDALLPSAPLVVVLHGCGQTAGGYARDAGWLELADRYGFVVLCPEQVRANNANLCFNWFEGADIRRGSGEAASIAQMVRHALADLKLDATRVFITGLSAGGAMAAVMLATYPELFVAGAVIAGLPYGAASGMNNALSAMRRIPDLSAGAWGDKVRVAAPAPNRWPSIAIWHGDADTTVTPAAARALALQWCDVHGATRSFADPSAGARHAQTTWLRSDGSVCVALHEVAGLGHGTPIAAGGEDGCGSPAPWILEAGLSSSQEIARTWGLVNVRRSPAPKARGRDDGRNVRAAKRITPVTDVSETIAQALRSAGLMR